MSTLQAMKDSWNLRDSIFEKAQDLLTGVPSDFDVNLEYLFKSPDDAERVCKHVVAYMSVEDGDNLWNGLKAITTDKLSLTIKTSPGGHLQAAWCEGITDIKPTPLSDEQKRTLLTKQQAALSRFAPELAK